MHKNIYHSDNDQLVLKKVQLIPNNESSYIYVDLNKFEIQFYEVIYSLYNELTQNKHIDYLLMPQDVRAKYIDNLDNDELSEISKFIESVESKLSAISNDLFLMILHINLNEAILQNVNLSIAPLDSLIRYISICSKIINDDYNSFSAKYINGMNYTFSRLISNISNLFECKDHINKLLEKTEDNFFQEVSSEYSETPRNNSPNFK